MVSALQAPDLGKAAAIERGSDHKVLACMHVGEENVPGPAQVPVELGPGLEHEFQPLPMEFLSALATELVDAALQRVLPELQVRFRSLESLLLRRYLGTR